MDILGFKGYEVDFRMLGEMVAPSAMPSLGGDSFVGKDGFLTNGILSARDGCNRQRRQCEYTGSFNNNMVMKILLPISVLMYYNSTISMLASPPSTLSPTFTCPSLPTNPVCTPKKTFPSTLLVFAKDTNGSSSFSAVV